MKLYHFFNYSDYWIFSGMDSNRIRTSAMAETAGAGTGETMVATAAIAVRDAGAVAVTAMVVVFVAAAPDARNVTTADVVIPSTVALG